MSAHYFNPQEMINKTIIFDERPAASVASSFHVSYGIDKTFFLVVVFQSRQFCYITTT
ncbi:UDP-glucose:(glucosyl) LPS alpha1,3-glucosyltransferase WaaO [Escherichia coli]|nr:UDP-glucose:(glucosyl) LPS alpha1,3-glucosyltransferase WaaO [Escherichia coli]